MLTKAQRHHESSLLSTAQICYVTSFVALASFVYSLVVPSPDAMDMYTRMGQSEHFAFVVSGRWYFLLVTVLMVVMGLFSVHKANTIRTRK